MYEYIQTSSPPALRVQFSYLEFCICSSMICIFVITNSNVFSEGLGEGEGKKEITNIFQPGSPLVLCAHFWFYVFTCCVFWAGVQVKQRQIIYSNCFTESTKNAVLSSF